jgi:hypothetical protein
MGLIPLLWLTLLKSQGHQRSGIWWGLAIVFAVSVAANTAAHFLDAWAISAVYPLVQAIVLGAVVLPLAAAWRWAALVLGAGLGAWSVRGMAHPEIFVHTVAWVGMLLIVSRYPGSFRHVVVSAFGLGWVAWIIFTLARESLTAWAFYQGVQMANLGAFCWATVPPRVAVLRA